MQKVLATIFSVVFHPIFMPVYGLLILFNSGTFISYLPYDVKKFIFLIILISTVILPLSFVPFYLYRKIIRNVHMDSHRERIIPLLLTTVFFYLGYILLNKSQLPEILKSYMLASASAVFLAMIVSLKWKISLHMLGIGGLIGAVLVFSFRLMVDLTTIWMILILIAGLVGYARLQLKIHNPAQVYIGFSLGLASVSGVLLIT